MLLAILKDYMDSTAPYGAKKTDLCHHEASIRITREDGREDEINLVHEYFYDAEDEDHYWFPKRVDHDDSPLDWYMMDCKSCTMLDGKICSALCIAPREGFYCSLFEKRDDIL